VTLESDSLSLVGRNLLPKYTAFRGKQEWGLLGAGKLEKKDKRKYLVLQEGYRICTKKIDVKQM